MGHVVIRLALLGLSHETNTFVPGTTTLEDFAAAGVLRGDEVRRDHARAHTAVAGMLAAADDDVDVVPLLFAAVTPSGLVEDAAFEALLAEGLDRLVAQGPWDGVLLPLHGAMVTAAHPDADGEVLRRVRKAVGPGAVVGCTLDMHANVSPRMVEAADVVSGYRTNPHVDPRERGLCCARLVSDAVRRRTAPASALAMVPAVISIVCQRTDEEPMRSIMDAARRTLDRPGVLDVSVFEGYPYADVHEVGMSVVVVTDGDPWSAQALADELADVVWSARGQFTRPIPSVERAWEDAMAAERGPVVMLDVGDNVGGGGTGDSTVLLAAAVERRCPDVVVTLHDPAAVVRCLQAGVGAELTVAVGGHAAGTPAPPVTITGRVRTLTDGRFEEPAETHGGIRFFDAGPTAVLETADRQSVICTTARILPTSLRQLTSVGIDPTVARVVVAKGVVSPVAAYAPVAHRLVLVDTPGVTTADLGRLAYRRRRTPLHPFDTVEGPPGEARS